MARRKAVKITFVDGIVKDYILLYTLEHVYVVQSIESRKIQLVSKTVTLKVEGDPSIGNKRNNR